jgi:hypothetical protein
VIAYENYLDIVGVAINGDAISYSSYATRDERWPRSLRARKIQDRLFAQ